VWLSSSSHLIINVKARKGTQSSNPVDASDSALDVDYVRVISASIVCCNGLVSSFLHLPLDSLCF